jgi:hypothetical protein
MKNKCAILIETVNSSIAVQVENYSKENVINGICKYTGFKAENIKQLTASMSAGIYCLKTLVHDNELVEIKEFRSAETPFCFEVKYIYIFN